MWTVRLSVKLMQQAKSKREVQLATQAERRREVQQRVAEARQAQLLQREVESLKQQLRESQASPQARASGLHEDLQPLRSSPNKKTRRLSKKLQAELLQDRRQGK